MILKRCSNSSKPGPDKIPYSFLKHLPSVHRFLATLYNKILFISQASPPSWCTAHISLIHKSGDSSNPANFRPIALTSVLGKIFHKILASRLEQYAIDSEIIDQDIQKGFLKGINGVIEHTFSMSAILEHARSNGLPVSITFIDLRNAFGSIAHNLIYDTLELLKIPLQIRKYIKNAYSQLNACIRTKKWSSSNFNIKRGVFQGDTLSPIIFLLVFNPIIRLVDTLQSGEFRFKIRTQKNNDLPKEGASIYVKWDEEDSDDEPGWYHCTVERHHPDGKTTIVYKDDENEKTSELIHLKQEMWKPARKNGRKYFRLGIDPPSIKLSNPQANFHFSVPHKVKGYADDLSIISDSFDEHVKTVQKIDQNLREIDLAIRPDKCVTLQFNGKKVLDQCVDFIDGETRSILEKDTKFLGATVASSRQKTCD